MDYTKGRQYWEKRAEIDGICDLVVDIILALGLVAVCVGGPIAMCLFL